jgi:hypothetical protein
VSDLDGFAAVLPVAAVCNDPVGDLSPKATYAINQLSSVRLARRRFTPYRRECVACR